MAAASTDKFRKIPRRWVGQIGSGGVADNSTGTISLASTTNLPTDTGIDLVVDRVDADGTATPSLEETATGVVSGSNLTSSIRGQEGTAQAHNAGSVVEALFTAKTWNDHIDGHLVSHNQDGTIKNNTVTAAMLSFSIPSTDGWTTSSDTWVYASASTFTIAGADRTAIFTKGTRLKFTNSTLKYAVVVSSSFSTDTTVTIAVNTDYVLANTTISSPYYSYQASPQGYPTWFNWTPTLTASGSMTLSSTSFAQSKFAITGKILEFYVNATTTTGGTASTTIFSTVPVNLAYTPNYSIIGTAYIAEGSASLGNVHWNSSSQSQISIEKFNFANYTLAIVSPFSYIGRYEI